MAASVMATNRAALIKAAQEARLMETRCECGCSRAEHRRRKDGVLLGCITPWCGCLEYEPPPANTTHITIAVERMKHAALLEEWSDGN